MSKVIEKPKDMFSHDAAHITLALVVERFPVVFSLQLGLDLIKVLKSHIISIGN